MRPLVRALRVAPVLALAFIGACGGGAGGGLAPPAPADFSGDWLVSESRDDTDCGGGVTQVPPYDATITQTGATLNLQTPYGALGAEVSGSTATVTGTLIYGSSYVTFPPFALVKGVSGLTGTATWHSSPNPTGTPIECSGTSTFSLSPVIQLLSFAQASQDGVALNATLEFVFSREIDQATITPASIQIWRGPSYSSQVPGTFQVNGASVYFDPELPGLCTLEDSGLMPDTDYRVTLIGTPDQSSITGLNGAPLARTASFSFHTRRSTDAQLFEDAVPGSPPAVLSTIPVDGAYPEHANPTVAQAVYLASTNRVVVYLSENVNPCTVTPGSVRFFQHAKGSAGTTPTGFLPKSDQTLGDPFTWGSGTPTSPPLLVNATFVLSQTRTETKLEIVPDLGEFPENALLVLELTAGIQDFGGNPLVPVTVAFVTENQNR